MKAILTFNMPEDKGDFNLAYHGTDWAFVCLDLSQKLRSLLKYDSQGYDEHTLEFVRDLLYDLMDDNEVSLDMIT